MRRSNSIDFFCLVFCSIIATGVVAQNEESKLPEGLALAGLKGDEWRIYIVRNGHLEAVEDIQYPRTFSYHADTKRIAYIGADSKLEIYNLQDGKDTVELLVDPDSRYTQPRFSDYGDILLAVELPSGKSRRTNIVGFDVQTGARYGYVRKRTAQFEPSMGGDRFLYYSTAICVDDCGGMIWELWRRDMQTGKQVQLTLLNAVSNQPQAHGDILYFSSDFDNERFHLWRMDNEIGSEPTQMTFGQVRDSDPATTKNGDLYFLRNIDGRTRLMRWNSGDVIEMEISGEFDDMRNLEISP